MNRFSFFGGVRWVIIVFLGVIEMEYFFVVGWRVFV
jgi:hypothetical protein